MTPCVRWPSDLDPPEAAILPRVRLVRPGTSAGNRGPVYTVARFALPSEVPRNLPGARVAYLEDRHVHLLGTSDETLWEVLGPACRVN